MILPILTAAAALTLCPEAGLRRDCVVDGDTVWLGRVKIREATIDTPEIDGAKCHRERALGIAARKRFRTLLNEEPFEVRYTGKNDRFGRPLATFWNSRGSIGDQLIREGLARPYAGGRRPWC